MAEPNQLALIVGTIFDCAALSRRDVAGPVWVDAVTAEDDELLKGAVDQFALKMSTWLTLMNHPDPTPPLEVRSTVSGGSLDLEQRMASQLVADLVNLASAGMWERRSQVVAIDRPRNVWVAAGEQLLSSLFELPDAMRAHPERMN